jgi:integrase
MVDIFMDKMLGVGEDYDDIDEVEILERSESADSTFRQAKSIFSRKGQKIFRRAGLAFEMPTGFLSVGFLPVTHGIYTLPEFYRIESIFEELRTLRETDPRHYLARLIGLYVNLRPKEIIHLRKDQIQYSGYWKVEIRVRADFKPKHYHERSIKIATGLAEHILEICRDNGSEYVISGGNRSELFRPFNKHLKSKFLPAVGRPSYELRKFYASASNLAVGLKTTHKRMGHKNSATTEDHYIDKDTSQELVDLYEKYARELFDDVAFPK